MNFSLKKRNYFDKIEPWLYLMPFLLFVLVFTIYPVINVFTLSLKKNYSYLRNAYSGWGFENYQKVFSDPNFHSAIINTFLYVIFVVPISTVIAILIANLLNKKIKGIAIFQTAFFLPMVTSITAIGLVWRFMYNQNYGLFNYIISFFSNKKIGWVTDPKMSLISLIIFGVWNNLPFTILILLSGLQNIDELYYTAAKVDGAKPIKIFFRITVPLLSPTIFFVSIVNTISCFKVFSELFPIFNGKPGPYNNLYTVVYYIRYAMFEKRKYGYAAAASAILFFIILLMTLIQSSVKKILNKKGLSV